MYKMVRGMDTDFAARIINHLGFTAAGQYKQTMPYVALISRLLKDEGILGTGQEMMNLDSKTYLLVQIVKKSGFKQDPDKTWFRIQTKYATTSNFMFDKERE